MNRQIVNLFAFVVDRMEPSEYSQPVSAETAEELGNDVAAPIFRDVAETILNGE